MKQKAHAWVALRAFNTGYTDALKVEHYTVTNLSRIVFFKRVHCVS